MEVFRIHIPNQEKSINNQYYFVSFSIVTLLSHQTFRGTEQNLLQLLKLVSTNVQTFEKSFQFHSNRVIMTKIRK